MIRLLSGDCRDVLATLAAESVHTVVTSPPYYGLRDYGTALWDGGDVACDHKPPPRPVLPPATVRNATFRNNATTYLHQDTASRVCRCGAVRVDRQIGLEPTPDEYLATMVQVFREVRRVLRRDGTCWVNMGDSYAGSWSGSSLRPEGGSQRPGGPGFQPLSDGRYPARHGETYGLKPKDLLLMPARLALALQADGWWVRSDVIWHKPNPMPESCRDRPTSAHEHVYLLTKAARYFYDADAVREAAEYQQNRFADPTLQGRYLAGNGVNRAPGGGTSPHRNLRNVWTIATSPYPNAHFATYPAELAERCIKAGTSERGCCAACGKPWQRIIERGDLVPTRKNYDLRAYGVVRENADYRDQGTSRAAGGHRANMAYETTTTGWAPGCQCDAATVPCTVLDPFIGAGTTALVADRLQRDCIGIDLNTQYTRMAMERCVADAPLFTSFAPAEDPEDERMADLFTDMAAD